MKVQVFFLLLLTSAVVFAQISAKLGGAPGEPGAHEPLIGTWRLVSAGTLRSDSTFEPFPEGKAPDAEKLRSYDAFFAYCGTYEVRERENRVIHRPEMGSYPHDIRTDQNRNFRLEGDRLILSEEETPPNGERRRYQITWERIRH